MSNGNSSNLETFYVNVPEQLPGIGNGVQVKFIVDVQAGSLIDFNSITLQNATNSSGVYYLNIIFGHLEEGIPAGRHEFTESVPAAKVYNSSGDPIEYYVVVYNDGSGDDRRTTISTATTDNP
ncbi:MAG: hypothetical protein AB8B74_09340 [Crocinitomicaceae bacterium]